MDGQPLRYRLEPNGSFTLYSVGEDGRDDEGLARSDSTARHGANASLWDGPHWVWPQAVESLKRRQS
jgi:hypothetical protein